METDETQLSAQRYLRRAVPLHTSEGAARQLFCMPSNLLGFWLAVDASPQRGEVCSAWGRRRRDPQGVAP
jgi:hypothetical protein